MSFIDPRERAAAHANTYSVDFYAEALKASAKFRDDYDRRMNVVKASEMPFERSPNGLIKHIINEKMNTKECCLDIYMQFLPPGKASGKHRHLSEEVFYVVEGEGYDLHWDVRFDCHDRMEFDWEKNPSASTGSRATSSTYRPIARISISTPARRTRRESSSSTAAS